MAVAAAIAGILAPMVIQWIYDSGTDLFGHDVKKEAYSIAQKIAKQISTNNSLLSELQNAYNKRDSQRMSEILQDAGYGARSAAIKKAASADLAKLNKQTKAISDANTQLEQQANVATTSATTAGGTFLGTASARTMARDAGKSADTTQAALQQTLQGGNQ